MSNHKYKMINVKCYTFLAAPPAGTAAANHRSVCLTVISCNCHDACGDCGPVKIIQSNGLD